MFLVLIKDTYLDVDKDSISCKDDEIKGLLMWLRKVYSSRYVFITEYIYD